MKTRATPKQHRARQRVRVILQAAATVLQNQAPDDLTTGSVAEVAGVPVSSIYRYFPTIEDLIQELYLQAAEDLRHEIEPLATGAHSWRQRLRSVMQVLRRFLQEHPYYRPLLVIIAAKRGPQTIADDFNTEIVSFLQTHWEAGHDGFHGGVPKVVATTVVQIILSLEELLIQQETPALQQAYFTEMQRATERYLEIYLAD